MPKPMPLLCGPLGQTRFVQIWTQETGPNERCQITNGWANGEPCVTAHIADRAFLLMDPEDALRLAATLFEGAALLELPGNAAEDWQRLGVAFQAAAENAKRLPDEPPGPLDRTEILVARPGSTTVH